MKLQRTLICIAGIFIAAGFATSQAGAGGGLPPGCTDAQGNTPQIEINALRAGGPTISAGPNQTTAVTAKARIVKGTALSDTTIDMTLLLEAVAGSKVLSSASRGPITIGVGKGGKGAKLTLAVPGCEAGFITFRATFTGPTPNSQLCKVTREIRKECR
jgi:hypothetical protein